MKHLFLICLSVLAICFSVTSCSSDDNGSSGNNYPQTVNIKFDITTTRNSEAIITRTLDNNTETENVGSLPYSFTYAQQEVNSGTYLKLIYKDNQPREETPEGSSWTDYEAVLKMSVGNEVIKTETFQIVEDTGIVMINFTFE